MKRRPFIAQAANDWNKEIWGKFRANFIPGKLEGLELPEAPWRRIAGQAVKRGG